MSSGVEGLNLGGGGFTPNLQRPAKLHCPRKRPFYFSNM